MIILKLVNVLNCKNNDKNGSAFHLDILTDYQHIYFAFYVLKKAHEFIKQHYDGNEFSFKENHNFVIDEDDIPLSQKSSISFDESISIKTISELELNKSSNLFGQFKFIGRDKGPLNYFGSNFYDQNDDKILIRYPRNINVKKDAFYLLKDVKMTKYYSGGAKFRIDIVDENKFIRMVSVIVILYFLIITILIKFLFNLGSTY